MGGLVSLQVACDHPARVSGLLLTNAGGANIGPERLRWILAILELSLKKAGAAAGGTVNDAFVSAVLDGLREYYKSKA
jgi:pimeloyl-ACP methyl ester carboxylesterase